MEPIQTCPVCHTATTPTSFFCPHCGKKLKNVQLSTTIPRQAVIYFVSFFLPPFGLHWAFEYLRQKDTTSKIIGIMAIVLTVLSIVVTIATAQVAVNMLYGDLTSQMGTLKQLGY